MGGCFPSYGRDLTYGGDLPCGSSLTRGRSSLGCRGLASGRRAPGCRRRRCTPFRRLGRRARRHRLSRCCGRRAVCPRAGTLRGAAAQRPLKVLHFHEQGRKLTAKAGNHVRSRGLGVLGEPPGSLLRFPPRLVACAEKQLGCFLGASRHCARESHARFGAALHIVFSRHIRQCTARQVASLEWLASDSLSSTTTECS